MSGSIETSDYISRLPQEIIEHIFSDLSVEDLVTSVPYVSKQWKKMYVSKFIWKGKKLDPKEFSKKFLYSLFDDHPGIEHFEPSGETDFDIYEAAIINFPELKDLTLVFSHKESVGSDVLIKLLSSNCNMLTNLNIGYEALVSDHCLNFLPLGELKQLKSLGIKYCISKDNCGLHELLRRDKLQGLENLDLCLYLPTDDTLLEMITEKCLSLKKLKIFGCGFLSDNGLKKISNCTELRKLDVSCCNQLTDLAIKYIIRCTKLKELILDCCFLISNEGLQDIIENLTELHTLSLEECDVNTDGIRLLPGNLKKLSYIDLTGCSPIDEEVVQRLRLKVPHVLL